jgi:uncharacterized iron-regulated membrane protein
MMRTMWVTTHRWLGLTAALFLLVAGLSGAALSWGVELDRWLNPQFHADVHATGQPRAPGEIVAAVEAADPGAVVTDLALRSDPGQALAVGVQARRSGGHASRPELGYTQVFVDPYTARILGRRDEHRIGFDREHLVPTLQNLHTNLLTPERPGWGRLWMGAIAVVWILNLFVGVYLTLPLRRNPKAGSRAAAKPPLPLWRLWGPAWKVQIGGGPHRLALDLHRAFALWFWGLLLIQALTGVEQNLRKELVQPALTAVAKVTPGPFDRPRPTPSPAVRLVDVVTLAAADARGRGWREPPVRAFYSPGYGVYTVRFLDRPERTLARGVTIQDTKELYFDDHARPVGERTPWKGSGADIWLQLRTPLHSHAIYGRLGPFVGLVVGVGTAMMSVTGVLIWWRKRGQAPRSAKRPARTPGGGLGGPRV